MNNNIPTFTPPTAPTFTPPKHSGPCCTHHKNEEAVAKCARCGNYICQDCKDVYGVEIGKYKGQSLCYDCCRDIVSKNVKELKKQTVKFGFLLGFTVLGMIMGAILFADTKNAFLILFGILWMGSFWTWLKGSLSYFFKNLFNGKLKGLPQIIGGFIGSCIGGALVAPINTIRKLFRYIKYLVKVTKALKSDTNSLAVMKDYMEYTLVRSQNKDVDLDSLMNEGSQLYGNTYARRVLENGEIVAEQELSRSTTRITETGEIIRNFAE